MDNTLLTKDTQIILKVIQPTLENIKIVNEILDSVITQIKRGNSDLEIVKKILIGDVELMALGEGPGGIKKDVNDLKKVLEISKTQNIKTVEDLLDVLNKQRENEYKQIISLLSSKLPWVTKIQGIKDIVMAIGLIVTMILSIMNYIH